MKTEIRFIRPKGSAYKPQTDSHLEGMLFYIPVMFNARFGGELDEDEQRLINRMGDGGRSAYRTEDIQNVVGVMLSTRERMLEHARNFKENNWPGADSFQANIDQLSEWVTFYQKVITRLSEVESLIPDDLVVFTEEQEEDISSHLVRHHA